MKRAQGKEPVSVTNVVQGFYYDAGGRLTDALDVGTNGGVPWARPATAPPRSDVSLVSSRSYDAVGWVASTTDPRGIVAKAYHDALGRTTRTIEAYVDGAVSDGDDKTTEYTYDGGGNLRTLKTLLTGGGYQKTEWVYGVSAATGSDVASNDLLAETRYPNRLTGEPSGGGVVSYQVNRLGEVKASTDRVGTTRAYMFDVVGRLTSDAVTTLGAGVAGAVLRQETAYDTAGRAYLFTSYDAAAGGNVVNQVQREFNGLGQLTRESQEVAGAVGGETPYVGYAYSEMAAGANHSRPTAMRYPGGKELNYDYGPGLDDAISRLTSLSDATGVLEGYDYLGLGTVVRRSRPQPGTELTYIKQLGEADGDAGDPYTGLDRFGRVADQRWLGGGGATDRFKYGYDRDGNRLYRENLVDAAFSELYHADGPAGGYDLLNQLKGFRRGALSDADGDGVPDTVSSPSRSQSWGLDAVGNFATVTTDGVTQARSHDRQNQAVAVGGAALAYDANGALTTDEQGRALRYDAWGRLVEVKQGAVVLASYGYDALGRRVTEGARELYYSASWQVVEERESGLVLVRLVFSPVYVDALVLRERDGGAPPPPPPPGGGGPGPLSGPGGPGGPPGTLTDRQWVQQDANWNVTSLAGDDGAVLERYVYDPYGAATVLTPGWGPRAASLYEWRYLHQGGRADPATGLVHFRNRDYSPALGRWLRNDPLGFAAGDQNLYRYVGNNAPNAVDPSGLRGESIFENLPERLSGVSYPDTAEGRRMTLMASGDLVNQIYKAEEAGLLNPKEAANLVKRVQDSGRDIGAMLKVARSIPSREAISTTARHN